MEIFMTIDENLENEVSAKVSEYGSYIFVKAKSIEEATALLPQGIELEKVAQNEYVPGEKDEKPVEHTYVAPMSSEEAERQIEEYKQDTKGARFVKSLENAYKFSSKTDKTGFYDLYQYQYLLLLAYAYTPHESIIKSYAYGYNKGYKQAQKDLKQREV